VHYRCDPRLTTIWADSLRLKQILVNLLSNAVKFTNSNGEIGLEVELTEAGDTVNFIVWDTGIGIAADDLPRLFQPFVQLDGRLNRRYGGTGLGLVIAQRLTELHQGSISVHSVVGQGSRFVVSLPNIVAPLPEAGVTLSRAPGSGQIVDTERTQAVHRRDDSGSVQ
jgi:signal transduction histidine kinase